MTAGELESLSQLIATLYDAVFDPALWPTLTNAIATCFDAGSGALQIRDPVSGVVDLISATDNFTPALVKNYEDYYFAHDLWIKQSQGISAEIPFLSTEVVTDRQMLEAEWYNDYCKPVGDTFYAIGAKTILNTEGAFAVVGVHKKRLEAAFENKDKLKLQLLLPHLHRALQLRQHIMRLSLSHAVHTEALAALATGAVVTDRYGRILFSNAPAESVLHKGDYLTICNGFLQTPLRKLTERLQHMINAAATAARGVDIEHSGGWLSVPLPGHKPLRLLICPLPRNVSTTVDGAIIFLHCTDGTTAPISARLQQIYGLTMAESRLAQALIEGESLSSFAKNTHISLHTAKNHLRHIFEKTGHTRQIDFIRDALSNPLLKMALAREG